MKKKAIIVSGYFNPIHKGHLEYFHNAKAISEENSCGRSNAKRPIRRELQIESTDSFRENPLEKQVLNATENAQVLNGLAPRNGEAVCIAKN